MKGRSTLPRGVGLGRSLAALAVVALSAALAGAANRPLRLEQFTGEVRAVGGSGSRLWVGQIETVGRRRGLYSLDISNFESGGTAGEPQPANV